MRRIRIQRIPREKEQLAIEAITDELLFATEDVSLRVVEQYGMQGLPWVVQVLHGEHVVLLLPKRSQADAEAFINQVERRLEQKARWLEDVFTEGGF